MKEKFSGYLGNFQKEDFSSWKRFSNSTFFNWTVFLSLVLFITLLMNVVIDSLPSQVVKGTVSQSDIWADKDYEILDVQATEGLRQEAGQTILPQYIYDSTVVNNLKEKVTKVFADSRSQLRPLIDLSGNLGLTAEGSKSLREAFAGGLGIEVDDNSFKAFVNNRFSARLEVVIQRWLAEVYTFHIIEDKKIIKDDKEKGVAIRKKGTEEAGKLFKDWEKVRDLEAARAGVGKDPVVSSVYRPSTRDALVKVTRALIQPSLFYDETKTKELRDAASAKVQDVIISIQSGESIVRQGARYDDHSIKVIQGIVKTKAKAQYHVKIAGVFVFLTVLLFVLYSFGYRFVHRFRPTRNDLVFFGVVGVLTVLMVRIHFILLPTLARFWPDIPTNVFHYLIPVAALAMLVRLMVSGEVTTFFIIALMGMLSFMFQGDVGMIIYYMASCFFGALIMTRVSSRFDMFKAGLYSGLFNAFLVITLNLIYSVTAIGDFVIAETLWKICFGFMGGIFASIFVMIITPIVEAAFHYLTDIKLLEFGSLNHPLLRELIVRAPGTYHHSHMVGTLSEAGCNAIGANGLFARVACYFHDIGKMKKPEYFIENQKGDNKHERLSPSMSALIIASHVKDGIELAKSHKLPQKIIDIIPEHQGTKLISYFYAKAKEMEKGDMQTVKEDNYRYPGPKPQTREAGVILLADTVEAATRSLKDRGSMKLKTVIQNMINKNFTDGQLDECDMTLKDLHTIADEFTRILVGIYHQRVEYPDPEPGSNDQHMPLQVDDTYKEQQPVQEDSSDKSKTPQSGNIRHLRP
jgi:cyclic-di-AMP phosphodiesterase PgpH